MENLDLLAIGAKHSTAGQFSRQFTEEQWLAAAREIQAAERERWQRIATNAQAVTTGCEDKLDYFEVPSHLMAALALALDEGPNAELTGPRVGHRSTE